MNIALGSSVSYKSGTEDPHYFLKPLIMHYLRFIIFWSAVFCTFSSRAQKAYPGIKIPLDTLKYFQSGIGNMVFTGAEQVWVQEHSIPDSILWKWVLQKEYSQTQFPGRKTDSLQSLQNNTGTSQINCSNLPDALYILTKRQHDTLTVSVLRRWNPLLDLDKEINLSYPMDSLKKWALQGIPHNVFPRITINCPYCINNRVIKVPFECYLIPVKNKNVSFNDSRLNEMPLLIADEKIRNAEFANARLYFLKQKYLSPDSTDLNIKIFENGAFQRNKIINKLRYKDQYRLRDTFIVGSKLYRIDSISHNWQYVYLYPLKDSVQQIQLSPASLKILAPYFKNSSDKMIVDFWGTWCNPCIEKLPALKELHQQTKGKFNFLSICIDKTENTDKAKDIFLRNKIEWPQVFVDMSKLAHTIVSELEVSCFPTYMIINKKGEITFSGCGTDGFNALQQLTLKN